MDPIQQIKDRADIVELISGIIPVKKSGANYVSVCPFHNDTKPSMYISPSKGIFKCFACGAGGDIFKFWSDYYQKDFKETLKELAQKYGVELTGTGTSKEDTENFNLAIRIHELAATYYHDQLLGSEQAKAARDYLSERKISTSTISSYQLGYSPSDPSNWGKLIALLKDKLNVTEQQIVSAGLALQSEKNAKYFDRFRGRLMIPTRDERGRVIAFGARLIPGQEQEQEAKYLNSPETSIYHKGDTLFGIDLAKEFIRKEDGVIVVEGYFDQISLHQAGIKNAVANQGTALTAKQVKTMAKFTAAKRIYLCFDSDEAGQKASDRAVEIIAQVLTGHDYETRILHIPEAKDADEFIQNHGLTGFQNLIKQAPLVMDYKIEQITQTTDLSSPQSKAKAIKELSKYLRFISNKIELAEYKRIIAAKFRIDETTLNSQLNTELSSGTELENPYAQTTAAKPSAKPLNKQSNGHIMYAENAVYAAEQELIVLILRERKLLEDFLGQDLKLIDEVHQHILETISDVSFENPDISNPDIKFALVANKLAADFKLTKELATIGLKLESTHNEDQEERYQELLVKLNQAILQKEKAEINTKLQNLDEDSLEWEELNNRKLELHKQIQKTQAKQYSI